MVAQDSSEKSRHRGAVVSKEVVAYVIKGEE
jgi:hypothetical protein